MINSMTGFGSAKGMCGKTEIAIELKSVNNRYLDCTVKIPRVFMSIEKSLKSAIKDLISRGKVDIYVSIDLSNSDDVAIKVNHNLAQGYISAMRSMAEKYDLIDNISVVDMTRFSDVIQVERIESDIELLDQAACDILHEAFLNFDMMRKHEGEKLKDDITEKLQEIEKMLSHIEAAAPESIAAYRKKLENRMREFLQSTDLDDSRVMMEVAIFSDRVAIDEETTRLRSHISQLLKLLDDTGPVGRKIDFLIQEFNREVNTIASKCNDALISKIVVDIKAEIEKMREQAQNIE